MRLVFFRNRLGWRLVLITLVIGSVLSVFSTGIQLVTSFERQKNDAVLAVEQIDRALSQPLAFALWTFDYDQINIILDSLLANEAVIYVELIGQAGERWERGTATATPLFDEILLVRDNGDGAGEDMGSLRIEVSLVAINARILEQFWVTLLSNLTKAYLAAFALLYAVHRLILRHLHSVVSQVDGSDPDGTLQDMKLDRKPRGEPDDLDRIVIAIRNFERRADTALLRAKTEIRERIKSEQEARKALSVRSSFIGTISHEVRTPLNAILGFLHLIESDKDVPDKHRHYANVATKAAQQLHNQLTNVLEMSRLDSDAVTIALRPTDLRRLADQWQETATATVHFHRKEIDVQLDFDPELDGKYMLDGARLTQMVTNLTDNAAKFTAQGQIRIALRAIACDEGGARAQGLEISVSDTGIGIPEQHRGRVFERFAQRDESIGRDFGGSGLGLTISREIATLMGAHLTLDETNGAQTNGDGYSTRFLITLGCIEKVENSHG